MTLSTTGRSSLSGRLTLRGVGHIAYTNQYNAWLYKRKKQCITSCFQDLSLEGKEVLDVGCGTGFFVNWYLQRKAQVCGLDITEISVDRLKERFGTEFYVQDITDPTYRPPRQFDIVNMWDVIFHIVDSDRFERTFTNIARSLKPGDCSSLPIGLGGLLTNSRSYRGSMLRYLQRTAARERASCSAHPTGLPSFK